MKIFFLLLVFITTANPVFSDCTFKTGDRIRELQDPSNVISIVINVAKSAKYARNLFEIATSKSENIPPNLKKKFKAEIVVSYPFGMCVFNGRIRQNGDWKDHIQLSNAGNLVRSLDVKLNDGNILSAVRFKLLLPETRGGANEILIALILKKMGIVSPETFSTEVSVNGVAKIMLFQENATKELLERNLRRESAIFEGDEELLWSYKEYDNLELGSLALSRLTNPNWFIKGASSQAISLAAFSRLQKSYFDLNQIEERQSQIVFPNNTNRKFDEYAFALLVMNATHGMAGHNRKYYFNAILNEFEPIYYDGNAQVTHFMRDESSLIREQFKEGMHEDFVSSLKEIITSSDLQIEFKKRVQFLGIDTEHFFQKAVTRILENINVLSGRISNFEYGDQIYEKRDSVADYTSEMKNFGLDQIVFLELEKTDYGYSGILQTGDEIELSIAETAELISDNTYNSKRAVFVGKSEPKIKNQSKRIQLDGFPGVFSSSEGIQLSFLPQKKEILIEQTHPSDWALIFDANLTGWSIRFIGIAVDENTALNMDQRFNSHGITGCLSIYGSYLEQTSLEIEGGGCEDSLNIISSNGHLKELNIKAAFADAIDMDFSRIAISNTNIQDAGNDCFDVSGGTYLIESATLQKCGDKGMSVGENSTLSVQYLKVVGAKIGVSSKDYSIVNINSAAFERVTTCVEAKQKKQEFGGAFIGLDDLDCIGEIEIDQHSTIKVKTK